MLKIVRYALYAFIPLAVAAELVHANPIIVFILAALGIIPCAGLIGQATEHLAAKAGAGWGSFLNATFGNAAELIICIFALREGLHNIVKASLTGAIIGNVLLVVGVAFIVGGLKREKQTFNRTAASMSATLLLLSAVALIVPALFHTVTAGRTALSEHELSLLIAIVVFIVYLISLVFSFKTHKHLYAGEATAVHGKPWSLGKAVGALTASTTAIAFLSEVLVGAIEPAAVSLNMSQIFVGVVLVAIIGNAAEHFSAITFAADDKMDITLGIALGSSSQVALLVAPLLVFISYLTGNPMDLIFTVFEVAAILIAVLVVKFVAGDGESNWMEGVLLTSVYIVLAVAFWFIH